MKTLITITEYYIPLTDDKAVRISIILLEKKIGSEELYNPKQELCIDFRKDYATESEEIVDKLRKFADAIENAAR